MQWSCSKIRTFWEMIFSKIGVRTNRGGPELAIQQFVSVCFWAEWAFGVRTPASSIRHPLRGSTQRRWGEPGLLYAPHWACNKDFFMQSQICYLSGDYSHQSLEWELALSGKLCLISLAQLCTLMFAKQLMSKLKEFAFPYADNSTAPFHEI